MYRCSKKHTPTVNSVVPQSRFPELEYHKFSHEFFFLARDYRASHFLAANAGIVQRTVPVQQVQAV